MRKLGLVFPGQGAQHVGMGQALFDEFEIVRETFSEACGILGYDVASLCFEGPQEDLDLTINTQTTVLTLDVAAYRVYEKMARCWPRVMAGHSLGEYGALCAAGAISFPDALRLVQVRSQYQQEAVPVGVGSMAAIIGLKRQAVENLCREVSKGNGVVSPSIFNSPDQTVVSGHTASVESVMNRAKEEGAKRAIRLPLSVPFHCALLEEAAQRFRQDLLDVGIRNCSVPVISNCEPEVMHSAGVSVDLLVRHVTAPVRWQETIEKMRRMGVDTIIEIGPKRILSAISKRIDDTVDLLNVEDPGSLGKTLGAVNA